MSKSAPGRKDPALLADFVEAVRSYGESRNQSSAAKMQVEPRFGPYGGRYVPETLMPALDELAQAYREAAADPSFQAELMRLLETYAGRPTALFHAERLSAALGCRVLLKREDLLHTGAHKINNCLGQALLAQRLGKRRIVAETGAGQHGVATATVAALLGLECVVYMGEVDMLRQAPNVERMQLLGARVIPVAAGTRTLKDATSEAIRDWVASSDDTHYIIGSAVGPHPYPAMVRDFQRVIGNESRRQCIERYGELPSAVVACVGGGSNAIGMFSAFLLDTDVALFGAEAAGAGLGTGRHSAALACGRPGVLHGSLSYLLQDADGQVLPAHSISAGLDYPGVGPEHSLLADCGRVEYGSVTDEQALRSFAELARLEGIIPALESAHALALARELAPRFANQTVLVCLSGRGDKDMTHALAALDQLENRAEVAA